MQFAPSVPEDAEALTRSALDVAWEIYTRKIVSPGNALAERVRALPDGLRQAEVQDFLAPAFSNIRGFLAPYIESGGGPLIEHFSQCYVLCLTEDPLNQTMWSHYAGSHKGCVLRFMCVPELDSYFGIAQPIKYTATAPTLGNERTWAGRLFGVMPLPTPAEVSHTIAYTESMSWAYEGEWRIYDYPASDEEPNPFILRKFHEAELTQVIFGLRASTDDRQRWTDLVMNNYAQCSLAETKRNQSEFKLTLMDVSQ